MKFYFFLFAIVQCAFLFQLCFSNVVLTLPNIIKLIQNTLQQLIKSHQEMILIKLSKHDDTDMRYFEERSILGILLFLYILPV